MRAYGIGVNELAGLAIHKGCARYIQLREEKGVLEITRREQVPLPEEHEDMKEAFSDLRKRLAGFLCPVVLGIPAMDVKFDVTPYPRMPLSDVRDSLILDFEERFPYSWNDAVMDMAEIESPGQGRDARTGMTVLTVTSRRTGIEKILTAAERAGLPVRAVEPVNVALFRLAATGSRDGAYLVAGIEPERLDMILGYRDNGIFFRSVLLDAETPSRHIRDTAAFIRMRYRGVVLKDLFLWGEVPDFPSLKSLLEAETSLRVHPAALEHWNIRPGLPSGFEAALGLALRDRGPAARFDLRPPEYVSRERRRRSFNPLRLAALVSISAFLAANAWHTAAALLTIRSLDAALRERRQMIGALEQRRGPLLEEISRLRERTGRLMERTEFLEEETPVLEALMEIERRVEPGTWLTGVRIFPLEGSDVRAYGASVEGSSDSEEELIALSDGLRDSAVFTSVTLPVARKEEGSGRRVVFEMSLVLNPLNRGTAGEEGEPGEGESNEGE